MKEVQAVMKVMIGEEEEERLPKNSRETMRYRHPSSIVIQWFTRVASPNSTAVAESKLNMRHVVMTNEIHIRNQSNSASSTRQT